ncbi:MAG: peptidase M16 [Candidatus Parcubacteria bacterium]|nr:MAG: peptidase M16 [Candidatus Parcubacteria bacterium]
MSRPQIIIGPKGLKILLINNPESLSTSFLILVGAGSDWETKKNNGIFHFLEHLYFKGTKNYPSAKILMEAIDDLGGAFNAFTSYEYTGYYIKVLPEYGLEALKILSDIILNPLFPEEEIEKERNVIFEEINLYHDRPQDLVIEIGNRLTFGDQPAGWSIIGTKETVAKIKKEDILKIVRENYSAKNTLVIISGKIHNQQKLIDFIFQNFKNYNSQRPKPKPKFKKPVNKYKEKIVFKDVAEAHIFLGFPLPGLLTLKEKRIPFGILSIILGGKASSRLWLKIREELGAAYYIRSYFTEHTDRSLFFVHAGLNLEKLDKVLKELVEEIKNLKEKGVEEKELETSKAVLKSGLFMDLEDSLSAAMFYGQQYLLVRKLETPKEIERKINKVSVEEIRNQLKNIFNFSQANLAVILPEKFKINFAKILSMLK